MVAFSHRCLISTGLALAGVEGARLAKRRSPHALPETKFIAGIPILNYHAAYGGRGSLNELDVSLEEDWLVMMHPRTTDTELQSLCKVSKNGCKHVGHPSKGGIPFIDMRGTEKDLAAVLESAPGLVHFVEPEQILHMIPELDEKAGGSPSWGLDRVGANGRSGNQGEGVNIFIMDTGVRTTHQDFGDRASPAVDFTIGDGGQVCNGDLECAADRQGHGTHCAGSAAGTTFGVASKASVHGIKVLGDGGAGGLLGIVGGIDWVAASDLRPAVGSMSLGGKCPLGFCGLFGIVKTAIDVAVEAGVTIVVAGGNDNTDSCGFMPAFVPSAITVGSTDSEDWRSYFSNYGRCTNIWAPGSAITSAGHLSDTASKTASGTSMACPHVAGGAAMILEKNPSFKAPQVLEKLHYYAAEDYIVNLKDGDINKLLYLAADAPPPKGTPPDTTCSEDIGHCGLAYQACCIPTFGSCQCKLTDGNGTSGPNCGRCGSFYQGCCERYAGNGHPCKCAVK